MVQLYYNTSWKPAYCHTPVNGKWTSLEMKPHPERKHWRFIELERPTEFVFTDLEGNWDNPPEGQNYAVKSEGAFAVYHGEVLEVDFKKSILLVADLDNTLVGSHPDTKAALDRFNQYWIKYHYFNGSRLVYSTGRSLEEYLKLYEEGQQLLDPDMLVTAVGSDVYTMCPETGEYKQHFDYYDYFDGEHWDSTLVFNLMNEHFPWLIVPQTRSIFPFKIWRTCKLEDWLAHKHELKEFLRNDQNKAFEGKVIKAKVIVSGAGDYRYIDITPNEGGKKMGLVYAQKHFMFSDEDTLVAGDSGNDIDMFRGDHWGVIVANHQEDLEVWYHKKPRKNKFISEHMWADAVVGALEMLAFNSN